MTHGSTYTGPHSAAVPRTLLSRNIFVALVMVVAGCAATSRSVPDAADAVTALIHGVIDHKVLWMCLAIATWHLLRTPSPPLQLYHLIAALPAIFLASSSAGLWPWIGLSITFLMLLAQANGQWGRAGVGLLIGLMAALHAICIDVLSDLSGDALLTIDAWIAGSLARLILPGLVVHGTALQYLDGHMLVLVWGCSSLSNLGDVLLLFWAIVSLYASGTAPRYSRGRLFFCCLLLACLTVLLNALRLALMVGDTQIYAYLHAGDGATWFRMATLGVTAIMSVVALWHD